MKNKYFFIYLLSVFLIVWCFDSTFSVVTEKTVGGRYNSKINKAYTSRPDIAIVGASRASHHYIPQLFEDSLSVTTYNYGIDGQNIFVHYAVIASLLRDSINNPKVILLDLSSIDLEDQKQYNTERLDILYPYYTSDIKIKELLNEVLNKEEIFFINNSALYRHNSAPLAYFKNYIQGSQNDSQKGFLPLSNQWNDSIEIQKQNVRNFHPLKLKYLNRIIELCKNKNVKLILVISPHYAIVGSPTWISKINYIATQKNVPFFNFENSPIFLEHPEWFNEPYHLNKRGAQVFTDSIINKIKPYINTQ